MSIVPQITNCRQYIPQNAKSPEKSELLRAVKMWYSSTRSHMGQQTDADILFVRLCAHGFASNERYSVLYHKVAE